MVEVEGGSWLIVKLPVVLTDLSPIDGCESGIGENPYLMRLDA